MSGGHLFSSNPATSSLKRPTACTVGRFLLDPGRGVGKWNLEWRVFVLVKHKWRNRDFDRENKIRYVHCAQKKRMEMIFYDEIARNALQKIE